MWSSPWAFATPYAVVIPVTMVRGYGTVKAPETVGFPRTKERGLGFSFLEYEVKGFFAVCVGRDATRVPYTVAIT